jgi:hypothetical protein
VADLTKYISQPLPTAQERQQRAQRLRRWRTSPGLSPEQSKEGRRLASNLLNAGPAIDRVRQKRAKRNQHPQHPTKQ